VFQRILGRISVLVLLGVFLQLASALPQLGLYAQVGASNGVATFTPSSVDFGAVAVGSTSATQQISLSNTGTGPLGIAAITATNSDYAITANTCSTSLAVNASCLITVSLTPSFEAPDPGGIVVTDDGPAGTATALLSGTGVESLYVLPFQMVFDGQAVGTPSAAQQAIFTNTNDGPQGIDTLTTVGNAATDFTFQQNCDLTIPAGGTCPVSVVFKPSVAGPRTADLEAATGNGTIVSHLTGNGAIRHLQGFTANILPPNDDDSSPEVTLPFSINFFGTTFSSLFVNNNGNVTFTLPLSDFTPSGLNGNNGGIPIIAAYWADVDTTGAIPGEQADAGSPPSAVVTYGVDTVNGHTAFGVDYENVGYFSSHTSKLNSFQLILIDRSDTGIAGAFDMEFNYDKIQWEVGDASTDSEDGSGLCGTLTIADCTPAAVGYSNGTGDTGTNFQLPGSFVAGALLDNGPVATSLIHQALNGSVPGRTTFQVRNGTVQSADLSLAMTQGASTVPAGSNQTYTLTIGNAGPNDATNTTASDTLPTNATLVSATPSQGAACAGTTVVTCNVGTVANAGSATVTIVVKVNAGATGNLVNSASVISDLPDPNMQNNTASVTATIGAATNFTLTVAEAGSGTGTVSSAPAGIICPSTCSASFASGTQVTLTPTANAGSTFAGWSGACTGTTACVVTMTAAESVTATFNTSATVALTITEAGTGTGTVTSVPAGINCKPTCTANFASGTVVTLTATPATGSTFTGWGGATCEGTGTCTFTITAATTVTANFGGGTTNFALTVTDAGTGTGTVTSAPAGISCKPTCTANFASGTAVTLTATPATGSTFTGWSAPCEGTGTCTVTITAATTVTANFGGGTTNFALTVTEAGSGTGTVSSAPAGISCKPTCSANFASGTAVTLTATPAEGSTFTGWSAPCEGTGTCTVTITAATAVTATFNSQSGVIVTVPSGGSTNATTTPGGTAFFGLQISAGQGTTGTVQLGCSSQSPFITCTVIPSSITLNGGTTTVAFGIQTFCTGATSAGFVPGGFGGGITMMLMAMMLGSLGGIFGRNRRVAMALAMFTIVAILGLGACSSLPKGPNGATPAGTYPITLTTTLNGQTQTFTNFLTLTVK
jgi:uncharacterized repeat protein (TIGR01451 family)